MPSSQRLTHPTDHLSELVQAKLMEYQQCFETYRYLYTTLWQLGAIFGAISGVMLGFGGSNTPRTLFGVGVELVGWIPVIAWYFVFFRPMHRYALIRSNILVKLEEDLNNLLTGLDMRHMTAFNKSRDRRPMTKYLYYGKWWSQPSIGVSVGTLIYFLVWFEIASILQIPSGVWPEVIQWVVLLSGVPFALLVSAWDQRSLSNSADKGFTTVNR